MSNSGLATYGRPQDKTYFSVQEYSSEITLPTTSDADLGNGWSSIVISEDGVTPANDLGTSDPVKDWAGHTILAGITSPEVTLEVPIIDNSDVAHKILYGTANYSSATGSTFDGTTDTWSIVITELHNDEDGESTQAVRYVYPMCVPTEWDEGTHAREDVVVHTVTFRALYYDDYSGYYRELPAVSVTNATTSTEE